MEINDFWKYISRNMLLNNRRLEIEKELVKEERLKNYKTHKADTDKKAKRKIAQQSKRINRRK